jgi:hypothetical protein
MMDGMTLSERIAYYITLMRIAVEQDCTDPVGYANTVYAVAAIKPEWCYHWRMKQHD